MKLQRALILTFLVFGFFLCHAQNAILVRKMSRDSLRVVVKGTYEEKGRFQFKSKAKTYLMTDIGNFDCSDIQALVLNMQSFGSSDIATDLMGKVNLVFIGSTKKENSENRDPFKVEEAIHNSEVKSAISEAELEMYRTQLSNLQNQLESFRVERQQGKQLQVAGAVFGIIGAIIISSSSTANTSGGTYLAIGGLGLMTAGFIIDWDAGKHLRKKK